MSDTQALRASDFGVLPVRSRQAREIVDFSEKENVDEVWAKARQDARIERESRSDRSVVRHNGRWVSRRAK